jgi:hypothetical protein
LRDTKRLAGQNFSGSTNRIPFRCPQQSWPSAERGINPHYFIENHPAERGQRNFPATRDLVAFAPALIIGLRGRAVPGLRQIELKASLVGSIPFFPELPPGHFLSTLSHTKGLEMDWMMNDCRPHRLQTVPLAVARQMSNQSGLALVSSGISSYISRIL